MGDKIRRDKNSIRNQFFMVQTMLFDLDLDVHTKMVYVYLSRCSDVAGQSFPSYSTIAKACSCHRTTAIKAVKRLKEVGLLTVETRYCKTKKRNTSNLYTIHDEPKSELIKTKEDKRGGSPEQLEVVLLDNQGGSPGLPRSISNEVYPFINHSIHQSRDKKMIKIKETEEDGGMDRQENNEIRNLELRIRKRIGYDELIASDRDKDLVNSIYMNILEMYSCDSVKVNGKYISQSIIKMALDKLDHFMVQELIDDYEAIREPITNYGAYMQTMIYNKAVNSHLSFVNNMNSR